MHSYSCFLDTCRHSGGQTSKDSAPTAPPRDSRGPTSVVDVPEGRVDELARVTRALRNIQEHRDGVVAAIAQIQQGLWKAGLPGGRLWGEREREEEDEGCSARGLNC